MAGRRSHNKPNSIASGWATQKLGNSLSRETLPRRPSLGLWRWEAEPPENPALRASRCDCRNSRQAGETETLLLKGTHEDLCIPGPGGRSSGLVGDWHCTASCGGWGGGRCVESTCLRLTVGTKAAAAASLGSAHWCEPPEGRHQPHQTSCRSLCCRATRHGDTACSISRQASGLPEHRPAPQRDKTQLYLLRSPIREPGQASQPQPPGNRQQEQQRQFCSPWNRKGNHGKLRQNETSEESSQMKEGDGTPEQRRSEEATGNLL